MSISISLIDFADYVMKVGPSQLAKVRELCFREDYHPSHDFWKGLREAIQRFHITGNKDISIIDGILLSIKDRKKIGCYPEAIKGYKRFLGRKKIEWFVPNRDTWKFRELQVRVNPDLGLVIDGIRYLVKLHFKGGSIDAHKLKLVFALMRTCLSPEELRNTKMAVIEVSKGKMYIEGKFDPTIGVVLEAQAISFIHLWNAVETEKQKQMSA